MGQPNSVLVVISDTFREEYSGESGERKTIIRNSVIVCRPSI